MAEQETKYWDSSDGFLEDWRESEVGKKINQEVKFSGKVERESEEENYGGVEGGESEEGN